MPYTVTKLITNAFYISGIVSRDFQTVSGPQFQDGLDWLNEIFGDTSINNDLIPYFNKYVFTAVTGQETYFVPHLIELDTLVFFIDTVRYQMSEIQRRAYFGSTRAQNIQSLPFTWHVERAFQEDPNTNLQTEGANLSLYFLPNTAYPMEAWGLFGLTSVVINQDLALVYPPFYINYLKYQLAVRICNEYSYEIPYGVQNQLDKYIQAISKRSQQLDLRTEKISTLGTNTGLNYAIVNFGGWVT